MLAGILIAHFNPSTAIGIDAMSFLVSAVSLSMIRLRRVAALAPKRGKVPPHQLSELVAGIRFLFQNQVLRTVTILFAFLNLVSMGALDLFIYRLKHDLHQSAGTVGFVLGVASTGAIAAGIVAPILRRRFGFGACWIGGLMGTGLGLAGIALTRSVAAIVVFSVAFMFVSTVMSVTNMSLRQQITPDHLLGRVTAAFWTLAGITAPFGAAVATALAAPFGSAVILCAMGVTTFALAAVALFTPVNHRHPERLFASREADHRAVDEALAG
jgi:MFS family permease